MNEQYKLAGIGYDWLSWLGMPMLYDGGLCVNRTLAEHEENNKYRNRPGLLV